MSIRNLEALLARYRDLGIQRLLCKRLAENDNSKQQIYLGGSFDVLNVLPFRAVRSESSAKRPNLKASLPLKWLNEAGSLAIAPGAQLILYPDYPEVRMSGFLLACPTAPSPLMQAVPREHRQFNNGPDGRLMFLGILPDGYTIGFVACRGSRISRELDGLARRTPLSTVGVFLEIPLTSAADSRSAVLTRLREIHAVGWHDSCRLDATGVRMSYVARNGAGYTLEALFGVRPNGRADPDFLGWELKACGSDRVTLMTPEPDQGYYANNGAGAFVRRFGYDAGNDTLYFTGIHRIGTASSRSRQTIMIRGFDQQQRKILNVDGGVYLVTTTGEDSAGWSFRGLLEHWGRKHAAAAYINYESRTPNLPQYRFLSPAFLGEGTSFPLFLSALAAGQVVYDPAPKVTNASSASPRTKPRSQFRISRKSLACLYNNFRAESLG